MLDSESIHIYCVGNEESLSVFKHIF
jgi:hypothetical protein